MSDDLRALTHDLSAAPARAQRDVLAVVERGAANIKRDWRDNATATSGAHARRYPATISYDMAIAPAFVGHVEFVIGPDKAKSQGALGNLLEFGSVHNAPTNDGGRALDTEAPRFEAALATVTLDALGWH